MPQFVSHLRSRGAAGPFGYPLFRRMWVGSLLSSLGLLIQGVGAAWAMTEMTGAADQVALVQTAAMAPMMLLSLVAGAVADMYDRRRVGLAALTISLVGATTLTVFAALDALTPAILLASCFVVGTGMALFAPAWQASVSEQVPQQILPSAIALNSISFNLARSFGPAIGGMIVAAAGVVGAFTLNAILYLPMLFVLFRWRREQQPMRLPPERLGRAIVSGVRYVFHSPAMRVVTMRTLGIGLSGGAVIGLLPLVARDLLSAGAETFGLLLGAFGVGAVAGALLISKVRARFSNEAAIRLLALVLALSVALAALSRSLPLTLFALLVAGAGWMQTLTLFNVSIQLAAPRWVAGRALAAFQTAVAAGIALGSWGWGHVANHYGVDGALLASAGTFILTGLFGLVRPIPSSSASNEDADVTLADPDVALALKGRSGPIVVEIEYRVALDQARAFYAAMQDVQSTRHRNGAYGWSIARDIADPELWTERYHCPTWHDYLRMRNRTTQHERALHERAMAFHKGTQPIRIRRMLDRPFGSVRWREDAPDRGGDELLGISG